MAADEIPEGPCNNCGLQPAASVEGLCARCIAKKARWRRAKQAQRQREAGGAGEEQALPSELRLDRRQVNALAAAMRTLGAARDVLDAVGEADAAGDSGHGPDALVDALWDLARAYDTALELLGPVLPDGILPARTATPPLLD